MEQRLSLPDVTLVAIDTSCYELTRLALQDCLAKVDFGDVLVFSDRDLGIPGRLLPCDVRSNEQAERWMWYGVGHHLQTSHALYVQWDGWLTNPDLWDNAFLNYDYIGAPWGWHNALKVGNGGFSLRSRRLIETVAARQDIFPFSKPEDDALCRRHRVALEIGYGLRWAPEDLAERFSFEHGTPRRAFGFHGLWNFMQIMDDAELLRRIGLLGGYIRGRADIGHLRTYAARAGRHALIDELSRLGF